jgi:hypothetical protein
MSVLTNRQLIRAEISALFDDIDALAANLAYAPLRLGGMSPILALRVDGTMPMFVTKTVNQFDHFFLATIFINREAHGAQSADNLLDQIYTTVLQRIRNQVTGTNYMELVASSERSRPDFAIIDGKPYRIEDIPLMARSNPNA